MCEYLNRLMPRLINNSALRETLMEKAQGRYPL